MASSRAQISASTASESRRRHAFSDGRDGEQSARKEPRNENQHAWGEWGADVISPYEQLRMQGTAREGVTKRVKRWLKCVAKAEGIQYTPEEDTEDEGENGWGSFEAPVETGWVTAVNECVNNEPDPLADEVVDPKLVANFHFVEKTAKKRKLSAWEARRLHLFFRASTEEKITKIQEIIRFLLPFVENENRTFHQHSQY
ncbi:hypothetical protein M422DRAFT_69073 [Sphaerobolus stellatus SS14]|uniref:Uncharacterized protein n=1 Tax=Sphaerobolus stellatus (strain SS14) TaxID=990650 RepID=A0A0C9VLM7_SPHS4|nr:hypothetical protein M422DRAFT_69073 [Sphaerobolus stellatus SS14]